jgi:hypothetical protein
VEQSSSYASNPPSGSDPAEVKEDREVGTCSGSSAERSSEKLLWRDASSSFILTTARCYYCSCQPELASLDEQLESAR